MPDSKNVVPLEPSVIDIKWGDKKSNSFLTPFFAKLSPSVPLFTKTVSIESALKKMSSTATVPYTPSFSPPPSTKNLNVPLKNSSFLFLAISLMLLGICFFIAGFLFSLWVQTPALPVRKHSVPREHSTSPTPSQEPSPLPVSLSSGGSPIENVSVTPAPEISPRITPQYGIQLGAFVTKENASDLIEKLKTRQIAATIQVEEDSSGGSLFCVRTTNQFPTYKSAESAANTLFQQEAISAFVVPLLPATKKS